MLGFFASSCSSRDHLLELRLDFPLTSTLSCNISCSPSLQCSARAIFPSPTLVRLSLTGVFDWKMWLGNGTVAYTAQLSDKHRCATFDWPEKAIILLYVILYSSKHFDLLHLSYSGSYVWILSVAAGDSSWFCFSILVVWVMTEVQSYQHVFFFFSYDCFSAWSSLCG